MNFSHFKNILCYLFDYTLFHKSDKIKYIIIYKNAIIDLILVFMLYKEFY